MTTELLGFRSAALALVLVGASVCLPIDRASRVDQVQTLDGAMDEHRASPVLELQPGGTDLVGTVIDAADGRKIPNCLVRARREDKGSGDAAASDSPPVATDEAGDFRFHGLLPGRFRVRAFGPSGYPSAGREVGVELPSREKLTIALVRGKSARGKVVDGWTGEAIAKFTIVASFSEVADRSLPSLIQHFDDPSGAFEYRNLSQSSFMQEVWLHVAAEGFADAQLKIENSGQADIENLTIEMEKGSTVRGKVVDAEGRPIAAARIELVELGEPLRELELGKIRLPVSALLRSRRPRWTLTDEKGEYRIEHAAAGHFSLRIAHRDFAGHESATPRHLRHDEEVAYPTIVLTSGACVTGRVVDAQGMADHATIQLLPQKLAGGRSHVVTTDGLGRFHCDHVVPGTYKAAVIERRGRPDPEAALGSRGVVITLVDGQTLDLGDLEP